MSRFKGSAYSVSCVYLTATLRYSANKYKEFGRWAVKWRHISTWTCPRIPFEISQSSVTESSFWRHYKGFWPAVTANALEENARIDDDTKEVMFYHVLLFECLFLCILQEVIPSKAEAFPYMHQPGSRANTRIKGTNSRSTRRIWRVSRGKSGASGEMDGKKLNVRRERKRKRSIKLRRSRKGRKFRPAKESKKSQGGKHRVNVIGSESRKMKESEKDQKDEKGRIGRKSGSIRKTWEKSKKRKKEGRWQKPTQTGRNATTGKTNWRSAQRAERAENAEGEFRNSEGDGYMQGVSIQRSGLGSPTPKIFSRVSIPILWKKWEEDLNLQNSLRMFKGWWEGLHVVWNSPSWGKRRFILPELQLQLSSILAIVAYFSLIWSLNGQHAVEWRLLTTSLVFIPLLGSFGCPNLTKIISFKQIKAESQLREI